MHGDGLLGDRHRVHCPVRLRLPARSGWERSLANYILGGRHVA
jgi:hypothetical protein